jgi:hypothetical protein
VIFGIVVVAAIVLAASLVYLGHKRQSGPPSTATATGPTNPPTAANGISSYDAATSFPQPSGSCVPSITTDISFQIARGDADGSPYLCINAGEPEPPYWKLLIGEFSASYPTSHIGTVPKDTSVYTVDFGDGNTGVLRDNGVSCTDTLDFPCIQNFSNEHIYRAAGQYTVRFYKNGRQIVNTLKITIAIPSSVCKLENIFIPNGTGIGAYDDRCDSEARVCRDGILSGSYKHVHCPLAAQSS